MNNIAGYFAILFKFRYPIHMSQKRIKLDTPETPTSER